ncbi:MAG: proton-conducting transporter membrane subunit, partial [Edaphobacter sp.]
MNLDHSILTIITFIPLAGAVLLALLPDRGKRMQWGALAVTLLTFIATLHLPFHYNYGTPGGSFQFEQNLSWITSPAIRYHLGVDGLSMWLVVLTGLLAPLGVLISWRAIDTRKKLFYIQFLLLQVAMFGVFVSLDLFLYYSFWELSLVPMVILIAIFGRSDNRRRAALKYFLYTFLSSALLL